MLSNFLEIIIFSKQVAKRIVNKNLLTTLFRRQIVPCSGFDLVTSATVLLFSSCQTWRAEAPSSSLLYLLWHHLLPIAFLMWTYPGTSAFLYIKLHVYQGTVQDTPQCWEVKELRNENVSVSQRCEWCTLQQPTVPPNYTREIQSEAPEAIPVSRNCLRQFYAMMTQETSWCSDNTLAMCWRAKEGLSPSVLGKRVLDYRLK